MKFDRDQKPAKWYLLLLVGIALVLILYTLVGFWVLPPLAKHLLEKNLSEKLHRKVTVDQISINPFELSLCMKGFTITEIDSTENFIAFDELYAVLQGGSIVERALILREVRLTGPYVRIARMAEDRFNFSDLLNAGKPAQESQPEAEAGIGPETTTGPEAPFPLQSVEPIDGRVTNPKFSVHNVKIINGTLDYINEENCEKERIEGIELDLPLISTLGERPDGWAELTVAARVNQSPLNVVAKAKPFSDLLEMTVDVQLTDFDISPYSACLPPQLQFKVRSGRVDAQAVVTYSKAEDEASLTISGEVSLCNGEVVDLHDSKLISLPKVDVLVESIEPLTGSLHIAKVLFHSPEVDLWRDKAGRLNLETLVVSSESAPPDSSESGTGPAFQIEVDDVELTDGRIGFSDPASGPGFRTSLEAIDLRIRQFKNTPGSSTGIALSARTESGETLELEGALALDPLSYDGSVVISGITLPKYAPYYQQSILFDVIDGKLDLKTRLHVESSSGEPNLKLSDLTARLSSLKLKKQQDSESFLEIPSIQVEETTLDLAAKKITVGRLLSENGRISSGREKSGQLFTQALVPAAPDLGTGKYAAERIIKSEQNQWKLLLRKAALSDYVLRLEDRMPPEPVFFQIDRIGLDVENISMEKEEIKSKINLSCRVNEGGTFQMEGNFLITPLFADLKLNLKDVEMTPVQPYLPEDVRVRITGGKLSAEGNLLLGVSKEDRLNASYVGDVALSDFSSKDTIKGEDLFRWKHLGARVVDAGNNPPRLNIKVIGVRDFFTRVAINPEGKISLLQILGYGEKSEPVPTRADREKGPKVEARIASKAEPTQRLKPEDQQYKAPDGISETKEGTAAVIKIDRVSLRGGEIAFSDTHIKPSFRAELLDIGGTISGLSSEKGRLADVNLRGKLYRSSPLEIVGKISPFAESLFVDLGVNFKNIDLTRWNPYAQKYVGYTVEKGNLHLELKYLIAKKKLDSQNSIVFDRLTLGQKVDSPDATTLPVKFAISLLQDRNGEIQLGIPVAGDLDDPQFSIGSVILSAVKNLLMKAVTAPFALLGAFLPQGVGEISHVDMDYTTGKIAEASARKLDALAGILNDRPNLELDIQGCVEIEKGKAILRQERFTTKVKTQKLKEVMKKKGRTTSADQLTIGPDEEQKYLKMAYDEEFPQKGFFKLDFSRKPSPEEMKTQLLSKIEITDEDVKSLAYDWALKVREYLLESGKVNPRGLFVLEPRIISATEKSEPGAIGVDLKLK